MSSFNKRLGFHYFPDTVHYREHDLQTWLPKLRKLGASWVTLLAPFERAIPEFFLRELLRSGITPILHFRLPVDRSVDCDGLRVLFSAYARWGIHYVTLFDRPNNCSTWPSAAWAQNSLVERFLDLYIPLAELSVEEGLTPVFPPLEPGGDYWDTAFLRTALRSIQRRGRERLLDVLTLGAYAWTGGQSLDWGAGGPERWPGARPYYTPPGLQDQLGFRIFDWYLAISRAELGRALPVLLLRAGSCPGDGANSTGKTIDGLDHARRNLSLARLIAGEMDEINPLEPIPDEVLTCNFWLLAAAEASAYAPDAWFQPDGMELPVVAAMRQWVMTQQKLRMAGVELTNIDRELGVSQRPGSSPLAGGMAHPIAHYVLMPLYAWGVAEWELDRIRPLVQKYHPTVGFSLSEARLAARVTIVGGEKAFSAEALEMLYAAGCIVEHMNEDGMIIAI